MDFSWVENFITRDTILGHPLDDVFAFRTAKVVRIQDRLLGGADLAIRVAIGLFVLLVLLMGQRGYVDKEPVVGTAAFTLSGNFRSVNSSKLAYCQGPRYGCRFVDEHVVRGGGAGDINKDHLFVTTLMSEREQKRQCDEDADVCEVHFSKVCFQLSVLHESPISLTREEFCQRSSAFKAEKADTFFAAGVDDFTIQLTHEAWAPFFYSEKHEEIYHGTDKDMDGKLVSFRDDGTGRVRMVDLQEIKPSLGLILTLSELLDAAGVALDKPIGAALARSDGDGALADDSDQNTRTVRETGVVIDCHIRYYNDWSTWSPAPAVRYEIEFAPATHQNPLYSASYEAVGFGDARMMVKRNGVYVRVRHEGHLEKFSVVAMLQTITIGFMLMTLSSWILAQVATRYLPLAERYETHKYEYTENIFNLRASRDEFNDRVIEPQISVHEQIERSVNKPKVETDMKDYGSMEPSKTTPSK